MEAAMNSNTLTDIHVSVSNISLYAQQSAHLRDGFLPILMFLTHHLNTLWAGNALLRF